MSSGGELRKALWDCIVTPRNKDHYTGLLYNPIWSWMVELQCADTLAVSFLRPRLTRKSISFNGCMTGRHELRLAASI